MNDKTHSAIDAVRLQASLDAYATFGATENGGVTRLALSDEDRAARDRLAADMRAAGASVTVDDLGNMRGRLPGRQDLPSVVIGSHLDTVVRGGRFDGALGVLGGLEVLRALHDSGVTLDRPVELVNWTNEEGARFEPAMLGSGAATGTFSPGWMLDRKDTHGVRLGDELERIGYRGAPEHRPQGGHAYLELHIEQGPVLDDLDQPVGIVLGILGITWIEVVIRGHSSHAGPTPMAKRRDALVAAADVIRAVREIGTAAGTPAVGTVGRIDALPNVLNTIPGEVRLGIDLRGSSTVDLERMVADLQQRCGDIAKLERVEIALDRFWTIQPTAFDSAVVHAIQQAATTLEIAPVEVWSGAGHDAKYAADVMPTGMIFVRSRGGVSHCEEEFSSGEDIALGAELLLRTTLLLAEAN